MISISARWLKAIALGWLVGGLAACGGGDDAPAAEAVAIAQGDSANVKWNSASTLAVTTNDTIGNGSASVSIKTGPLHGTAVIEGLAVRYTPAAGYFGTDTLRYALSVGNKTAEADVQLTVTAEFAVSGSVVDAPLAGASVTATVGSAQLAPVNADANGAYRLTVQTADPGAFISLKATGAGAQSKVVLTSLLGDARDVAALAAASAAPPPVKITNLTTAAAVLAQQSLGRAVTSSAELASVQGRFAATRTVDLATAIKLVADKGVALPAGSADTLALVTNSDAVNAFLAGQASFHADAYSATRQEVLGDAGTAVSAAVPGVGAASSTLLVVRGQGAATVDATRLVLNADKTALIEADAVRTARWTSDGSQVVVTYDAPVVSPSVSPDLDPATGEPYAIEDRETGFALRQLAGARGEGPAAVKYFSTYIYLEGVRKGTVVPDDSDWLVQTLVSKSVPFGASDLVAGTRWAGVPSDRAVADTNFANQDVMRIVDATTVLFERAGLSGTYRLADGKIEVTMGNTVFSYTRLFATGPQSEERWLTVKKTGAAVQWLKEAAVLKTQGSAAFVAADVAQRWESYVGAGTSTDRVFVDLLADGTGRLVTVTASGEQSPGSNGLWAVDGDGQMVLQRYSCGISTPGCLPSLTRTWRLLGSVGKRIYVMEHVFNPSGSINQYRLNVYTKP